MTHFFARYFRSKLLFIVFVNTSIQLNSYDCLLNRQKRSRPQTFTKGNASALLKLVQVVPNFALSLKRKQIKVRRAEREH